MTKMVASALLGLAMIVGNVAPASAAPCKDAKGKFVKCAPKPPVKKAVCKNAKGRFIKCR
ncbi:hypothetical protein HHL08_07275 [Sphingobium sp. AR-3-1]|uniref:Uncharacterized protein n=2 Tax=Sphingobium psychrophilum TaxID=2728834 RepID=A0A7X9ZRX1_9SPHN|nr:hypothetical protein [Sphingobium psychrophilum]